jgi:hypothetical protein
MNLPSHHRARRTGGVYIAVLGTSLVVALLAMAALTGQRIQNRALTASADIRQAQLNAHAAVELALLTMHDDANWRTSQPHGRWFSDRGTAAGTCSLDVTDPVDSNLANNAEDPVLVRGIGYSGGAEQLVEITIDPRKQPLGCLRSAVAAGDLISLNGDALRTNGLITANQVTATVSQVYGDVEGVLVNGSTYNGSTAQIDAANLPTMPDWSSVFNYYRTNATHLEVGSLSSTTPNLGRNVGIESGITGWTGAPPGIATADIDQSNNQVHSGNFALRVRNRASWMAGAAQAIDTFVEPNKQYVVEAWVYIPLLTARNFRLTLYTKGVADSGPLVSSGPDTPVSALLGGWRQLTATLTAQSWSGSLEYAFVKIAGADSGNTADFYMDDFVIREALTGQIIYRKVLGPGVNTFYAGAPTNPQGLYWMNCNGNRLVITRSRIVGTLLVVNPGPGSCIANGPISWTPASPGYPALLVDADDAVDADFAIYATNRALNENENGVNFNPSGATHEQFGQDTDMNDIYPSEIRGLIAIRDDLSFANWPRIRGQVLVGDDINNSSGELDVDFQQESLLSPPPGFTDPYSYLRRPGSGRKVVQ